MVSRAIKDHMISGRVKTDESDHAPKNARLASTYRDKRFYKIPNAKNAQSEWLRKICFLKFLGILGVLLSSLNKFIQFWSWNDSVIFTSPFMSRCWNAPWFSFQKVHLYKNLTKETKCYAKNWQDMLRCFQLFVVVSISQVLFWLFWYHNLHTL